VICTGDDDSPACRRIVAAIVLACRKEPRQNRGDDDGGAE